MTLRDHCARIVVDALVHHNGNKNATARSLGIAYHTLCGHLRRAERLGMTAQTYTVKRVGYGASEVEGVPV